MKAEARIGDHQYITSLLARIEELEKPLVDKAMALALLNTKVRMIPVMTTSLGGQTFKYIRLCEVLDEIDAAMQAESGKAGL